MNSFYSEEELEQIGFASFGKSVYISRKVSIYGAQNMIIGDNVRIDDYCILSGELRIGSNIHIAAYSALYGGKSIVLEDYTGISSRVVIYSVMDDFSGNYLIGPNQKIGTTNVQGGAVYVKKYAVIGTNSTVFPNLTINEGAVICAHSLVIKDVREWTNNMGIPVRCIGIRERGLLNLL